MSSIIDGKLYVVLTAENFHPGKGTPVTQLDMRRISDGVKVSERYRTTEQVERAFVEDRDTPSSTRMARASTS
jgi:elongation factor P